MSSCHFITRSLEVASRPTKRLLKLIQRFSFRYVLFALCFVFVLSSNLRIFILIRNNAVVSQVYFFILFSVNLQLYNGGSFQKQLVNTLHKMKVVTLNIVAWTQHPVVAALLQDPTWTGNGMLERWTFAFGMKVIILPQTQACPRPSASWFSCTPPHKPGCLNLSQT